MFDRSAKSSRARSARVRFGKFSAASLTSGGSSRAQVSGVANEIAATIANAANISDDLRLGNRSSHSTRKEEISDLSARPLEKRIAAVPLEPCPRWMLNQRLGYARALIVEFV